MTKRTIITLFLVALVAVSSFAPALADDDTPVGWGSFYDADGQLLPGVIQGGEISMPADWMPTFPD